MAGQRQGMVGHGQVASRGTSFMSTWTWTRAGTDHLVDMFREKPYSGPWSGFYPGITGALAGKGWFDPWWTRTLTPGSPPLTTLQKPDTLDDADVDISVKSVEAARLFRRLGSLRARMIDRPALTKIVGQGAGAAMGGGGLTVYSTSALRARVIHFDIGFANAPHLRVRATQIVEIQNGNPTICKFIKRACTYREVEDPANHQRWRGQLSMANYAHAGNHNFDF